MSAKSAPASSVPPLRGSPAGLLRSRLSHKSGASKEPEVKFVEKMEGMGYTLACMNDAMDTDFMNSMEA